MNTKPVQKIPTAPFFARLLIKAGEAFLSKDDHYVPQEIIREKIAEWENSTKLALYRMTSRYQQNTFVEMSVVMQSSASVSVDNIVSRRRILPALVEIEAMVKGASDKYQSTVNDYFTQSDLSSLIACLTGECGRLEIDVTDRILLFKEYLRINNRSLQFVGEMRVLHDHVKKWMKLSTKHNFLLEDDLVETLTRIFYEWKQCSEEKDAFKINFFFENIEDVRTNVYCLLDQIIPKKKMGRRWDIASLIEGFEMHHFDDCIM